jgi:hypothetical protein
MVRLSYIGFNRRLLMKINREDVLKVVVDALKAAQYDIQEEETEIIESTKPIGDLKYFDSLTSVYVTAVCFDSLGLGHDDPMKMPSLFIDSKGNALTVGEVVDRVLKLLKEN